MLARQPVAKAIQQAEADGDSVLAEQLRKSQQMREFAVSELNLPDNGSYKSYVPLKRTYPVWTVVAAEEFSVQAKQWCYPVIGCANYRGYFALNDAQKYASELQTQGLDTAVQGAAAYSTLGWFRDPLLPTMISYGEGELAELLFHELAHQALYVKNHSNFNEAMATVIGEYGATLWLKRHNPQLLEAYHKRRQAYREFVSILLVSRDELQSLYDSSGNAAELRKKKQALLAALEQRYTAHKQQYWGGEPLFDKWFGVPVNNARLSSIATYYAEVPRLESLLRACSNDVGAFLARLKLHRIPSAEQDYEVPNDC